MKTSLKIVLMFALTLIFLKSEGQKRSSFKSTILYQTDTLIITQLSENTFEHTSFLQTQDFGNVPCNGLIVRSNHEVVIFDTPATNKESEALINWIQKTLQCKINAIIPTHFHNDCLGGLEEFHKNNIPSYAYIKTCKLAKENSYVVPQNSFQDSLKLPVGSSYVTARFFGEGHTIDNVIGYFSREHVMFGGCLIKELDASKGYLGDANVAAWSNTVRKIKKEYPAVRVIVPGHGTCGNKKLLEYTIKLFRTS